MLAGRRFWFVGIGGAGLSGYAVVAHAWGAEVAGWDRHETSYIEHVRAAGIPVTIAVEPPPPPEGWEAVVSTAYAGQAEGRSRADFLAELEERVADVPDRYRWDYIQALVTCRKIAVDPFSPLRR